MSKVFKMEEEPSITQAANTTLLAENTNKLQPERTVKKWIQDYL